jgi:transcriptional antiterminator RfaH
MKWYVAQTKPSKERLAIHHLTAQGFATFFPRLLTRSREGDHTATMFPSYVFVRFDMKVDRWQSIHSTIGVQRLLGQSQENPSPVPPEAMEWFLARGELVTETVRELSFRSGETIVFTEGPLRGHSGEVLAASSNRVRLLLCLLGGQSVVYSHPALLKSTAKAHE